MNLNLVLKEIRRNLVFFVVWAFIMCGLIFFTMSLFPVFTKNQPQLSAMMKLIPAAALKFRGVMNPMDMFSILGFYAANNTVYMLLFGSIFSAVMGASIILKESSERTAEFLMSKPLTRAKIFLSKSAVFLACLVAVNTLAFVTGLISFEVFKGSAYKIGPYYILSVYTLLVNLLFGSAGLFISVLAKRAKPVTLQAGAMVILFYFIYTISRITETAVKFGYLSPFKYVDTDVLNPAYAIDPARLLAFLGVSASLFVLSFFIYSKKDILL
jgi:ABC-2 type transport system permease protein